MAPVPWRRRDVACADARDTRSHRRLTRELRRQRATEPLTNQPGKPVDFPGMGPQFPPAISRPPVRWAGQAPRGRRFDPPFVGTDGGLTPVAAIASAPSESTAGTGAVASASWESSPQTRVHREL